MKIAFGCQARVGKDTACSYLQKRHGGEILRFAAPLYDILYYAQRTCGFPEKKDPRFLQWVGTEWARAQDPDVWARRLIDTATNPSTRYYVADLRFRNEIVMLKKAGFKCVRIIWCGRGGTADRDTSHQSERDLVGLPKKEWDAIIKNDGTDNFYRELDKLWERWVNNVCETNTNHTE